MMCFFVNENLGYAVGEPHVTIKTSDGGKTWDKVWIPASCPKYSVFHIDEATGWIAGEFKYQATSTGGYNRISGSEDT